MIDLSKKYRTRRGGEVFGLCERGGTVYGWEFFDGRGIGHLWLDSGSHDSVPQYDLIEARKLRQWVLTETGEEPRYLKRGEYGLSQDSLVFCERQESCLLYVPLHLVASEVDETEPRGNG